MGWSGDWRGEAVKAAECRSMEDSASIVEVGIGKLYIDSVQFTEFSRLQVQVATS